MSTLPSLERLELHASQLNVYAAAVHGLAAESSRRTGLDVYIPADHVFTSVHNAVEYAEAHTQFVPVRAAGGEPSTATT